MRTGYLTVYMALSLTLIISLALALIEGTRSGAIRMESEFVAETGLESILAEYHRELFRQYNILALDTSYGEASPAAAITKVRLQGYLDVNCESDEVFLGGLLYKDFLGMEMEVGGIEGIRYITDEEGTIFRERAVEALLEKGGISYPSQIWDWMREIEDRSLTRGRPEEEREAAYQAMESYIEKESTSASQAGKGESSKGMEQLKEWISGIRALEGDGVLNYVVKEPARLSAARMDCESLVSGRRSRKEMNGGNLVIPNQEGAIHSEIQRLLFQEYMIAYGSYFGNELEKSRMKYQLEYVIGGWETDKDNLKETVKRILVIREAANTLYLMSDQEKRELVKGLSKALAAVLTVPEAAPALEALMVLGWAYVESLADVRSLLCGNRVPLIKGEKEWKTDMSLSIREVEEGQDTGGLSYGDYLRILLLMGDVETETFRFLDMVEADIRETKGNERFRMDGCLDWIKAELHVKSRYGYSFYMHRSRGY